jgi:general secretion pathway protein L
MPTLTLALPLVRPTVATEFEYVVSSDGRTILDHGIAPLALLPRAEIVVLTVPARALSWHAVQLPPISANRVRAALDGLLEDLLLDDATQMAFAVVPGRLENGRTLVAAFDKAWMRAVLEFFEQGGRAASRVVAEFVPKAPDANEIQLRVTGPAHDAILVLLEPDGVTCLPLASAAAVLSSRLAHADGVEVRAEPVVAELAEQILGYAVLVRPKTQSLLDASQCDWDLAQFDLALTGHGRMARRWRQQAMVLWHAPRLRAVRWGALLLLLVNLVGLNAWAWKLDAVVTDKKVQVKSVLTRTFPSVRTIVDAPLQMQRELSLLRQASGGLAGGDLETMMSALGAALPPASHAGAIDFTPGRLTVQGIDVADTQLETMRASLGASGFTVQRKADRLVLQTAQRQ